MAMRVVRNIRARPPCTKGSACASKDQAHLQDYSHPDDDDYGFSIRVHGGRADFRTLRQCFNFLDPQLTGYADEPAALKELIRHLAEAKKPQNRRKGGWLFKRKEVWEDIRQINKVWRSLDSDGNGFVSFPEFVEWGSTVGAKYGFPNHVGVMGAKGRAGAYAQKCTMVGCKCTDFVDSGRPGDRFCARCSHKRGCHAASPQDQVLASIPKDWSLRPDGGGAAGLMRLGASLLGMGSATGGNIIERFQLVPCGHQVVAQIQQLMDASVKCTWTRDRGRNPVPRGYQVLRVQRNENVRLWLKYTLKKALIREALETRGNRKSNSFFVSNLDDNVTFEAHEMRTSQAGRSLDIFQRNPLDDDMNEWLLWHGASQAGAVGIAEKEFKQHMAGSTTGTLYGRGTYLTDSCTKADEYGKEGAEDSPDAGVCVLLLCRVMGGRALYTDEVTPNADALERDVLRGPYDCVYGDREKCRGTFKELVIYDSSQAYPEYLVHYRRIVDPPSAKPSADSFKSAVSGSMAPSAPLLSTMAGSRGTSM